MTRKLAASEKITVDGKLDDPAWENAEWTLDMVDITRHTDQQLNAIPNDLQARDDATGCLESLSLPLTLYHTVVVTWRVYSYTHRHCMIRSGVM